MVDLTPSLAGLSPVADKELVARFDGGRLSSGGGLLVLREIERRLKVADCLAAYALRSARSRQHRASGRRHHPLPNADDRRRL